MRKACVLLFVIWIPLNGYTQGFSLSVNADFAKSDFEDFAVPSVTLSWSPLSWFGLGVRVETLAGLRDGCITVAPVFVVRVWLLSFGVGYPFVVKWPDPVAVEGYWDTYSYYEYWASWLPDFGLGISLPVKAGPGALTLDLSLECVTTPFLDTTGPLPYFASIMANDKLSAGLGYTLPLG